MTEADLQHMNPGQRRSLRVFVAALPLQDQAVVALIVEVGRAGDVVERRHLRLPLPNAVGLRLLRVGHEDHQHLILMGEVHDLPKHVGDLLRVVGTGEHGQLDVVEGVDQQRADALLMDELRRCGDDVLDAGTLLADVEDVLAEEPQSPFDGLRREVLPRHLAPHQDLTQFEVVEAHRVLLGRIDGSLPRLLHGERHHHIVGKTRLACARGTRDHHQSAGLEPHEVGEAVQVDAGEAGHAVRDEFVELFHLVHDGDHALRRHFTGEILDTTAHQILTARHQHIVGILALSPFHIAELIVGEVSRHLQPFLDALRVGVARIDDLHATEMLAVGIETGHARAAAVGQGDHTLVAALHKHRRIHHPLGDIDRLGSQHRVDVVGGDATVLLEAELLVGRLILHVEHQAVLQEAEGQEGLLTVGRVGRQFRPPHPEAVHHLRLQAPLFQVGHDRRGIRTQ